MKNLFTISVSIVIFIIFSSSCATDSKADKNITNNIDSTNIKNDTPKVSENNIQETEKIEPAKLTCKIYFSTFDFTDEESGETYTSKVEERKEFSTKKSYTFCYDAEGFDKLVITGTGKNLTLIVEENNKKLYSKENFEIKNKISFSNKLFDFGAGTKYKILIKQEDKIIFNGKIDSQGCR